MTGAMSTHSRFERWSPRLFLLAGVMLLLSAAVTVVDLAVGAETFRLQWGQLTVGLGWMAGLLGLLGINGILADGNRWLARIRAVLVGIGFVGYAIMTAGLVAIVAGIPEGELAALEPIFLPMMLVGSVLPFPLIGIACIRSDRFPSAMGVLLIAQTVAFIVNALTPTPASFVLVVLLVLMLINVVVGWLLRGAVHRPGRSSVAPTSESAGG